MELPVEESHWCNRHEMSYVSLSTIKIGVVLLAANSPASERYSEQNPTTWSTDTVCNRKWQRSLKEPINCIINYSYVVTPYTLFSIYQSDAREEGHHAPSLMSRLSRWQSARMAHLDFPAATT
jgi:hypothetical protein